MYSPTVTKRTLDHLQPRLSFDLKPRSVAESRGLMDHFNGFLDRDSGELPTGFSFSRDELAYIQSERLLCKYDFRYWVARYGAVLSSLDTPTGGAELRPRPLNVAQQIIVDVWGEMEELGVAIMVMQNKARQLGMCLDPNTYVLTADLRWVRMGDVKIGQSVVAVDEFVPGGRGPSRRLRRAHVVAKHEVFEPAFKLTFEDGRSVIATAEHRWLTPRTHGVTTGGNEWTPVSKLRVGDYVKSVVKPWGDPTYEDGWFGGMIDGEGSLRRKHRAGTELCVAQVQGPVFDRVVRYLMDHSYSVRYDVDNRKNGESSKLGNKIVVKAVVGRINEVFRLIGTTRPTRFLEGDWWEGKQLPGKGKRVWGRDTDKCWAKISSIEPLGERRMIDLQTTAGTYIAEGLVSHNSTIWELAICHRVLFWPRVNALIAAATPDTTRKMAEMTMRAVDFQPYWLVPMVSHYKSGETLLSVEELQSAITLQHGAQYTGVARGDTPTIAHVSEVSSFNNPDEDIDSSLMRAMHEDPLTLLGLESTAMELGDWWNLRWDHYVAAWPRREGRLRPLFLPWFVGTDLYPTKNWLKGHPIPAGWTPPGEVTKHADRARESVRNDQLLQRYLGQNWTMPLAQQWYYHCELNEARATKKLNLFLREMPTTAQESFQTANTTVFDVEIITELDSQRRPLLNCYGVECAALPQQFWPERRDFDPKREPMKLTAEWADPKLDFVLRPLRTDGYPSSCTWENRIFMWEAPQRNFEYHIGVDTAYGLNQDRCTIEVIKKGDIMRPAIQVAEYASGYMDAMNLTYILAVLATIYSPSTDAMLTIECRGPGDRTQDEIRKWGWGNFHLWERIDNRRKSKPTKIGWYTVSWSRDNLVVGLNKAIKDGDMEINSPWLIHELRTLSKDEMQQAIRAERGAHDDRYMATGMAFYAAHGKESMMSRSDYAARNARRLAGFDPKPDPNADWERRWQAGEHLFPALEPLEPNDQVVLTLDSPLDPMTVGYERDGTYE